jgi:hypothetical protein
MQCASIEFHRAPCFSFHARVFFHYRRHDSPHPARALPRNHAALCSMAGRNGRDQWRGGNPGRLRSLFSSNARRCRLGTDRVARRRFPREHSGALDRHGLRRSRSAHLDALGAVALSTALHRVDLSRLFKDEITSRVPTGCPCSLHAIDSGGSPRIKREDGAHAVPAKREQRI